MDLSNPLQNPVLSMIQSATAALNLPYSSASRQMEAGMMHLLYLLLVRPCQIDMKGGVILNPISPNFLKTISRYLSWDGIRSVDPYSQNALETYERGT